ncbi:MAG TPA: ABC transporter permease [Balneolales bacterium]|nr:ABC transporter permease [Balneolales bacterium]
MNIIEVFKMAFNSLKENKLRSFLTMIAIVVGVFAIIGASTAVMVIKTYFDNTLNIMGGNVVYVSTYPGVRMGNGDKYRNRKHITFRTYEDLQKRLRISRAISPVEHFTSTKVEFGKKATEPNVQIMGSNEFYLSNNAYSLENGRNISENDVHHVKPVCLIGHDVRTDLFPNQYAVGKFIRIDGQKYRVIGTVKAKGSTFGESQDNFVLIPYTKALAVYGGYNRNINIQVKAPSMTLIPATIDELTGVMRTIRKVPPGKENDFEIETNNSLKSAFNKFTGYLYLFGIVVGGISLLGAGIGVMNIMLVSVTERTKEIGIRKSVGAKKKAIISQFLLEAIFICQLGGIFGLGLGIIGGNVLAVYMKSSVVFPWLASIMGIIGLTLIGVLFGVFPAYKASKLDPVESLRYE